MRDRLGERGFVFVAVLFVMAAFFVLASALLFQSRQSRVIAANEGDHLKVLGFVEGGLDWATRTVRDAGEFSNLLDGPDDADADDDHLIGLRDLSLTASSEITDANEATASAIVDRDFDGRGVMTWEVVRIADGPRTRALLYVRLDDNHDDDPADPTNDDPLVDQDQVVRLTAVAEYPVFVDDAGVEQPNPANRGRAQRMLTTTLGGGGADLAAITVQGDLAIGASMTVCGDCATVHTNADMDRASGGTLCEDATASGSYSGSCSGVAGDCEGGRDDRAVPIINVYDDTFVPTIDTFDHSGSSDLPSGLRCPKATASDPGSSKYFALVADGSKGRVFKAYWDFTNNRWNWVQIDNLDGGPHIELDDCGRRSSDPNFGLGDAAGVNDGIDDEFYGWKGAALGIWLACASCSSASPDSLCTLTNNDFVKNGYYPHPSGAFVTTYKLPGNFAPDGARDVNPVQAPNTANWVFGADTIYSPLYGAVIWVLGNATISGDPGDSSTIDFQCGSGAGCTATTLPRGLWPLSLITLGSIQISGQANLGPANPEAAYAFQLIAGRDLLISGSPQEDTAACPSTCSTASISNIARRGGIYAVHEQIRTSGNANIFGFMLAETAANCSTTVAGDTEFNGNPQIYYDCQHPLNPWSAALGFKIRSWQEVE